MTSYNPNRDKDGKFANGPKKAPSVAPTVPPVSSVTDTVTATIPEPVETVHRAKDGRVTSQAWTLGGKLHRTDGPALVEYDSSGEVVREQWLQHGKRHREDGPAVTEYRADGTKESDWYYQNGKEHREDGPSYVYYHANGTMPQSHRWAKNGIVGDTTKPSGIKYSETGGITEECWYDNNKLHRQDFPAVTFYNRDGSVKEEHYWEHGIRIL